MQVIAGGIILTPTEALRGHALVFDEAIRAIVPQRDIPADARVFDAGGRYVAPGLVDVHVHGYAGEDTCDASPQGVRAMAKALLANGVTSFLPTTMTVAWEQIAASLDNVRALMPLSRQADFIGSEILGCHAEGPFINPGKKGAQSADFILEPDAQRVLPYSDVIRLITIAPEVSGGLEFIRQIKKESQIAISIGHTNATFEQALAAIRAGASHITHLFNAMTPLAHRDPGVVGAALNEEVFCELIADCFHVHAGLFAMLHRLKGDHMVLVTDCTRAGGLGDGQYTLGGQDIFVKGIECRLGDGTIAGSVLKLQDAVRNYHRHAGVTLAQAVHAASLSAASSIGLAQSKGSLQAGKDADIILMDADCTVSHTFVRGTLKYERANS